MGISDSALQSVRSKSASVAAPQAGGKNPDLTLHTIDGANGTLDPAFNAHVGLVMRWAQAWWEGWFCRSDMEMAFQAATRKLASCVGSAWRRVSGPVAAFIASMAWVGVFLLRRK